MGVVAENPPWIEVAQAQESLLRMLDSVRAATLTIISKNVKYDGTNPEQEKFKLEFSEIRGMVSLKKPEAEVIRAVDQRILQNASYEKFKTSVATGDDPFKVQ